VFITQVATSTAGALLKARLYEYIKDKVALRKPHTPQMSMGATLDLFLGAVSDSLLTKARYVHGDTIQVRVRLLLGLGAFNLILIGTDNMSAIFSFLVCSALLILNSLHPIPRSLLHGAFVIGISAACSVVFFCL
jgi:hypothetical protein